MPALSRKVAAALDDVIAEHRANGSGLSRYGLCTADGVSYHHQNEVCVASLGRKETRDEVVKNPGSILYYVTDGATKKDYEWFRLLTAENTPWQGIRTHLDDRCLDPEFTAKNAMILHDINGLNCRLFYNFVIAVRFYKEHSAQYKTVKDLVTKGIEPRAATWIVLTSVKTDGVWHMGGNTRAYHSFLTNYSMLNYAVRFLTSTPVVEKDTLPVWLTPCETIFWRSDAIPKFTGSLHDLVSHLEKHSK